MPHKISIFLILISAYTLLSAQEKHVGVNVGYGTSPIGYYFPISPWENSDKDYLRIGINGYYTPEKAPFSLKSGLIYDYRGDTESWYHFFRVPAGLDFFIGNTFQVIVGGGFNISCFFGEQMTRDYHSFNRFQLGVQYNMGFGYQISPHLGILLVYQNNIDIVPIYYFEGATPGGAEYVERYRGYDGFIKLGVRYSLNPAN